MHTLIEQPQGAHMIPIRCHAVAGVALSEIDGQTKMLLMNRVKGGFWCHVAGTVEAGETGWQTIVREFGEETGIAVSELYNGQYLEQFYEAASNTVMVVPVFVVYCPPNQRVRLNDEHTEYRWCTLAEAKTLVSFPGQKALYDHVWHCFVASRPSALMKVNIDP
jgi:dATP pyrophosphohydrolase